MLNGTAHPEALGQSGQCTWFHEMKWIKATQQAPQSCCFQIKSIMPLFVQKQSSSINTPLPLHLQNY